MTSTEFSPDSSTIVTAGGDTSARLWNARTGRLVASFEGHVSKVWRAGFSRDGASVITTSDDNTARIWKVAAGKSTVLKTAGVQLIGAFSGQGDWLVTATGQHPGQVWDTVTGNVIATLEGSETVNSYAVSSPDGSRLAAAGLAAAGSNSRAAGLWDPRTGKSIARLDSLSHFNFSPYDTHILTAAGAGEARLWDAATGKLSSVFSGHAAKLWDTSFSLDGRYVITASDDNTARLWDAATGKLIQTFEGHTSYVRHAVLNRDATRLVTGSRDETVRLWDAATGRTVAVLEPEKSEGRPAFSPDGTRVLTTANDGPARLWDAVTGKQIGELERDSGRLVSAVFSPDGTRIVTTANDNTIRLWDAASMKNIATLEVYWGRRSSVVFSPDGNRFLTTAGDKKVRLWDTATGRLIAVFDGHSAIVSEVQFSPGGTHVFSVSVDGAGLLWRVFPTTNALVEHAKTTLQSCIAPDRLRQFYLEDPPRWCITGAGLEAENDPAKWRPKWPYTTPQWAAWLAAKDRGEKPTFPEQ